MVHQRRWFLGGLVVAGLLAGGCGRVAGHVVQGKCLKYDPVAQTCVLLDEDRNQPVQFSLAGAVIGAKLDLGDVLRIYYVNPGQARRVMNVTKTDLSKK